jgi:hypothetical protein
MTRSAVTCDRATSWVKSIAVSVRAFSVSENRKPSVGFWATVTLVAVLVISLLYVASAGPVAYLLGRGAIENDAWDSLYGRPFGFFANCLPASVMRPLAQYWAWSFKRGYDVGLAKEADRRR